MRTALLLCVASIFQLARSDDISPFHTALSHDVEEIAKRQNGCPDGYNSCGMLGEWGACCQPDTICSRDAADNMACCPSGAVCTGLVPNPTGDGGSEPSTGFLQPTTEAPPRTTPPTTASTVPDAPYPFPIIPTTFSDSDECARSYTGCQTEYSSCRNALGGVHGVTVGGNAGYGITREAVEPTADAQDICSSLLHRACHGLQLAYCTAYDGRDPWNGGGNPGAASTRSSALYEILTGLAIALAGMIA